MAWSVDWRVILGGQDLTAAWQKVLIDISINDKAGEASDTCDLTIDDSLGQARLPSERMPLLVMLQGAKAFSGFVEKPLSTGSRSAGRLLKIKAKGFDSGGKAKEPQSFHVDDADLGTYLERLAGNAGLSITVDPAFASLGKGYWAADGESLIAAGERIARKLGGTFKIRGDKAIIAKRGTGQAPNGSAMPQVTAEWGKNLESWSITPRDPRAQFTAGQARWFDRASAAYKTTDLDFENAEVEALNVIRSISVDEGEARAMLDARKRDGERDAGSGTVDLDLTVGAVVEGICLVKGTRPGVDGRYVIEGVKHGASRGGGSKTTLDLKQPGGGAGKDGRKAGDATGTELSLGKHATLG
ncbi:MAG: late control D family protein [Candidatus Devosia phytovorans]|uniref:Late control D family protein n=1 Tax=Candidatus Devosia phytovorans TaxID=3121372 RepID=A0AAJ5VW33_9HYPH|nr:late control D family protein [Devosia sp.]WEK04577.1 MAG: late control D family protein [Devosia sp.]